MKALLQDAADAGIELYLDAGKLKARAAKGSISDAFKHRIREHKQQLLEYLQASESVTTASQVIPRIDRSCHAVRASFAQERLWFTDQLSTAAHDYNIFGAFEVGNLFDVEIAEQAFKAVILRHESLRSSVYYSGSDVMQEIHSDSAFRIEKQCLKQGVEHSSGKTRDQLLSAHAHHHFDFSTNAMLRVVYLEDTDHHYLSICMPHIVSDGWSEAILICEFIEHYHAIKQQRVPSVAPLSIQYRDYSQWQREWMNSPACESQLKYWKQQLAGVPISHGLQLDQERRTDHINQGKTITSHIGPELYQQIKQLAAACGVTHFMIYHAVLSLLIARHANSDDVVIGTPMANRLNAQVEPLIGFFINTLVLRTHCDETQTFSEFLAQVKDVNLHAQNHQFIPFSYLVEKLKPQRVAGVTPFFQILLTMDTNEQVSVELDDQPLRYLPALEEVAKYDITVVVTESEADVEIGFNYNSEIFSAVSARQLSERFVFLLSQCVTQLDRCLIDIPIESEAPVQADASLQTEVNTEVVHHAFARYAKLYPQRVALTDSTHCLSYQVVNQRANQLAHYLRQHGVGNESPIGLSCDRSVDTFIALLAILKAGATYVPFLPENPAERLEYIVKDAGIHLALCLQKNHARLNSFVACVALDNPAMQNQLHSFPVDAPEIDADIAESLCYIIYTSGSTGRPKGVMVKHKSLAHYANSLVAKHTIPDALNYAVLSTIATDLGNTSIYLALTTGGTLHIASASTALDSSAFVAFLTSQQIDVLKLTPSHFSALSGPHLHDVLKQIQYAWLGGERIPSSLQRALRANVAESGCAVINHYGPTETTIGFCTHELTPDSPAIIPIGQPFGAGHYRLLDRYSRDVPKGVPGELYIAGPSLARGYMNNTELSEHSFIELVQNNVATQYYRTGDWVKQNQSGELVFLGRMDHQVKVRGFRIELGEIERAIISHLPVESAVVVLRENDHGEHQRLIAYCKLKDSELDSVDYREMQQTLAQFIPSHMLPDAWLMIDTWPLMPNGKIDRRALPEPEMISMNDMVAVDTDREQELQLLWAELLTIDASSIGKTSHFFALGGHSLLAIRLVASVVERYQVDITIRDVFNKPVLTDFAEMIEHAQPALVSENIQAISQTGEHYELSYGQQLIWFIHQMERGSVHYNMPSVMNVEGQFDVDIAGDCLSKIIDRHTILRTVYVSSDEGASQTIRSDSQFHLTTTDLSACTPASQAIELNALIKMDAAQAFDLAAGLPIRAHFVKLASDSGKLLFNMHHIASDGWSMRVLVNEFCQNYEAALVNQALQLPQLDVQYADFAIWQRKQLGSEYFAQQVEYWEHHLDDLPEVHSLPMKAARPEHRTFNGAGVSRVLEQSVVEQLKQLAQQQSCTFFMVLHAAFTVLLSRYGNTTDIVVGTPVANRTQKNLEPMIGFFVNTLVLRTTCRADMSFTDLLAHTREVNLHAQANQDVPFELVVERLNPARSLQTSPLFQIMFTLDEDISEPLTLPNATITPEFHEEGVSKFELTVDATALEQGYFFNFQYNTDLFEKALIVEMAADFMRLLTDISRHPRAMLKDINQYSKAQLDTLLPRHEVASHCAQYFDERFALIAKQYATFPAIHDGELTLSYQEFDQRVNQMAQYLRAKGLQTHDVVCVLMNRSVDLLVTVMAVMRAGGIYMAMDTDYPAERIQRLLKRSDAHWCLTHQIHRPVLTSLSLTVMALDSMDVQNDISQIDTQKITVKRATPAQQAAYLLYTSGSTGEPKGVLVSHANLSAYADTALALYGVDANDRILQFSSIAFDIFIEEMTIAFLSGACLCLRTDSMVAGGDYFWQKIQAMDISVMSLPTGFWHQLVYELNSDTQDQMKSLRSIILGGERLSNEAVKHWQLKAGSDIKLFNTYGPTETTIIATAYKISESVTVDKAIPIGRALEHVELAIMAPDQSLTPLGCVGELYIGGQSVAMEYWQDSVRTQQRFVEGLAHYQGRLYRTGDLVTMNSQGQLEFIGRVDHQVKLGGYRVELGEIEQQLISMEMIDTAVVMAPEIDVGKRQLIAYVVLTENDAEQYEMATAEISQYLSTQLPHYMLPSRFVMLGSLPLTINGKVDNKKLPLPDDLNATREVIVPNNDCEDILRNLWSELLVRPTAELSIRDSFFELGGSSILSVRMILSVNQAFGVNLTVRDVFSAPTIESLAVLINHHDRNDYVLMSTLSEVNSAAPNLYCIPGVLGTSASFLALSQHAQAFNVLSFDHAGLLDNLEAHTTIIDMATSMLADIKQYQDHGPYIIVGHSMGAKIAYEVVALLEQDNEEAYLIILDSELHAHEMIDVTTTTKHKPSIGNKPVDVDIEALIASLEGCVPNKESRENLRQRLTAIYEQHALLSETHRILSPLHRDVLAIYAQDNNLQRVNDISGLTLGHIWHEQATGGHHSMLSENHIATCIEPIECFLQAHNLLSNRNFSALTKHFPIKQARGSE